MASSSPATERRRLNVSLLHRLIDQQLHSPLDALTLARRLLHQHEEHVLLGIDDEIAAARAVPFQLADVAGRRRFGVAGIGPHRQSKPEAETIAGEIEVVALDAGAGTDLV